MNKNFYSIILAAAALLAVGCSEEYAITPNVPNRQADGKVRFTLPYTGKSVTYTRADVTVPGEDFEYAIADMVIYQFDEKTGKYDDAYIVDATGSDDRVTGNVTTTPTPGNGSRDLIIDMGDSVFVNKHFYLVANLGADADATKLGQKQLIKQSTTEAEFIVALQQAPDGIIYPTQTDGGTDHNVLPMYGIYNSKPYVLVEPGKPVAGGYDVTMKRSVARIDIQNLYQADAANSGNDADLVTNFEIKEVIITGANTLGYAFPSTGNYKGSRNDRKTVDIRTSMMDGFNKTPIKQDPSDATGKTYMFDSKPSFYLLPTEVSGMSTGTQGDSTQIWIRGNFGNVDLFMPVKPAAGQSNRILANKIYRIKVKTISSKDIFFEFDVEDYEADKVLQDTLGTDTLRVVSQRGQGGFYTMAPNATNPAKNDSTFYNGTDKTFKTDVTKPLTEDIKICFTAASSSPAILPYISGLSKDMNFTVGAPTFVKEPTAHYEMECEITLPYQNAAPVTNTKLRILNPDNSVADSILIEQYVPYYSTSSVYPVQVGGVWWAPMNVGATYAALTSSTVMTNAMGGNLYQWGRSNAAFTLDSAPYTAAPAVTCVEDADPTKIHSSYVLGSTASDWLIPQNNNLWNNDDAQGPCPDGWRVPSEAELTTLITGVSSVNNKYSYKAGDIAGQTLFLPITGTITNAGIVDAPTAIALWASTVRDDSPNLAVSWKYVPATTGRPLSGIMTVTRSYGRAVRCILNQ